MKRAMMAIALVAICAACESSPQQNGNHSPTEKTVFQIDGSALLARVETSRDRPFEKRPTLKPSTDFKPHTIAIPDAAQEEAIALSNVFYGKEVRLVSPTSMASYDPSTHTITYDATTGSAERDVFLAAVHALDLETTEPPKPATSMDAWSTSVAVQSMAPLFALFVDRAQRLKPTLTPDVIAARPDLAFKFQDISSSMNTFEHREGLAFAAALYRANGWSGVEYGVARPPVSTGHLSRPDRWIKGEQLGVWKPSLDESAPDSFSKKSSGRIGPAFFERWFQTYLEPEVAASIHPSWLSDQYALYEDNGRWIFHSVSMWATPGDAEQIVDAIEHGLRLVTRDATFAVVRNGNVIAVVGVSDKSLEDHLAPAPKLATTTVQFFTHKPIGWTFEPTAFDQLMHGQSNTTFKDGVIFEPASGLRFPMNLGDAWDVEVQKEGALRWYAKREGAMIQCNVELADPLGVSFDAQDYGALWKKKFHDTLETTKMRSVGKTTVAGSPAWTIALSGTQQGSNEEVDIIAWQVKIGHVLTTISLIGDTSHRPAVESMIAQIESTRTDQKTSTGSIEYTVE